MGFVLHIILFLIYTLLAVGAGAIAPILLGVGSNPSAPAFGILAGATVFLLGALIHEVMTRREDRRGNLRRLLLLKRAYDRSLGDLNTARDEIRRIFEVIEAEGGEGLMERLRDAEARMNDLAPPEPRRAPRKDPGDLDHAFDEAMSTGVDPVPGFLSGRADGRPLEPAPPPRKADDGSGKASREMREVASEMRVLHSLVEQLYADRPPAGAARRPPATGLSSVLDGPRGRPEPGKAELRVVADRSEPSLKRTGGSLDRERVLDIVREGLRRDRVDLYLQPIVSLPQRKRRFYECYSRIRAEDGTVLGPDRYIDVSREAGLLTAVDNMLLFRCVQLLRKLQNRDISAVFFCNIAPNSLADREFFKDFIEYMEQHSELAPNLVLEVAQADFMADQMQLRDDFRRLGRLGYRFSLDRVKDLALDLPMLEAMHIQFVKIDAALILERLSAGGAKASEIRVLKQELDEVEIDLVVERIETESQLVELLDFNIDYGQGYLFGEPRPSKDPGEAKTGGARA